MGRTRVRVLEWRQCRYCGKWFLQKYEGQEYCCKACSNRDLAQHRQPNSVKPVYHGDGFTFSHEMITCLVADAERDRTAQAFGIPLKVCEKEIALLKETGEYAVIVERIENRYQDPDTGRHGGSNVSGHVHQGMFI